MLVNLSALILQAPNNFQSVSYNAGPKASLSQAAAGSLDSSAVDALQLCLSMSLVHDSSRAFGILEQLSPPDGWQLHPEPSTIQDMQPARHIIGPLPAQQAAIAAHVLNDMVARSKCDEKIAQAIVRFAHACAATLARLVKPRHADKQVRNGVMAVLCTYRL